MRNINLYENFSKKLPSPIYLRNEIDDIFRSYNFYHSSLYSITHKNVNLYSFKLCFNYVDDKSIEIINDFLKHIDYKLKLFSFDNYVCQSINNLTINDIEDILNKLNSFKTIKKYNL